MKLPKNRQVKMIVIVEKIQSEKVSERQGQHNRVARRVYMDVQQNKEEPRKLTKRQDK